MIMFDETETHFFLLLLSIYNQFSSFWKITWNFDRTDTVSPEFLIYNCSYLSDAKHQVYI